MNVTVRDLRNNSAEVLTRVERGESMVITRDGQPVAQVVPLRRASLSTAQLIARRQNLPHVDVAQFRADIDEILDSSL